MLSTSWEVRNHLNDEEGEGVGGVGGVGEERGEERGEMRSDER